MTQSLRAFFKWLAEPVLVAGLMFVATTAIAQPFYVPSGSMEPTLQIGDALLGSKFAYGYSRWSMPLGLGPVAQHRLFGKMPARGDVVVFRLPRDPKQTYVKRVIGLPGDTIAMRGKKLFINGVAAGYAELGLDDEPLARGVKALHVEETTSDGAHEIQWLSRRLPQDDFGPIEVPADHYLMLGDNRDNSEDSRFFGLVARENIIGRAERILVSADYKDTWAVRFSRFGKSL